MSIANYGGRQPNTSATIKEFNYGAPAMLWKGTNYSNIPALTPTSINMPNVYIPGNLYIDGMIGKTSDIQLLNNITQIDSSVANKLMNVKANKFTYKNDLSGAIHYGFIAQDFEIEYPELVSIKPDSSMSSIKVINYLEIIPLLLSKIQLMQGEIENLKGNIQYLLSKIDNLTVADQSLQSQIDNLIVTDQSLQSQIDNLTVTDQSLQSQIDNLIVTDQSLQSQIDNL